MKIGTNNCCKSGAIKDATQNSSNAVDELVKSCEDLHQLTNETFTEYENGLYQQNITVDPISLHSLIANSNCSSVLISCCENVGCCDSDADSLVTCEMVSEVYLSVGMETRAIVDAYVYLINIVMASVSARANATAAVRVLGKV